MENEPRPIGDTVGTNGVRVFNVVLDGFFGYGGGCSVLIVADSKEEAEMLVERDVVESTTSSDGRTYPYLAVQNAIHDEWDKVFEKKGDWVALSYYE